MAPISPPQCRAARALLDWSQTELANRASVSRSTVYEFERGDSPHTNHIAAIQRAFETAGMIFIAANGEGPGVRLKKKVGK